MLVRIPDKLEMYILNKNILCVFNLNKDKTESYGCNHGSMNSPFAHVQCEYVYQQCHLTPG